MTYTTEESGEYRIVTDDMDFNTSPDDTGPYDLYFAQMPGANEHGLLINDGVHHGSIDLGDLDSYTFEANAGDSIQLRMAKTGGDTGFFPLMWIYDPNGAEVASAWNATVATLSYPVETTGAFTVVLADMDFNNGYDDVGTYDLYFAQMPGANEHGTMTNGGLYQGSIDLGDLDSYTFSAMEGDTVQLRMTKTGGDSGFYPLISLYSPSGEFLTYAWNSSEAVLSYTAEDTGTFTVVLADIDFNNGSDDIGTYDLTYETDGIELTTPSVPAVDIEILILFALFLAGFVGYRSRANL